MLSVLGMLTLLSACGVIKDTYEGMTGQREEEKVEDQPENLAVEVIVDSDHDEASNLAIEIDARKHPESIYYDSIELPYREEFSIPMDVTFPLSAVRVEAEAADDAREISCTILYNGHEEVSHHSEGDSAKAVCEKKFQLGPG